MTHKYPPPPNWPCVGLLPTEWAAAEREGHDMRMYWRRELIPLAEARAMCEAREREIATNAKRDRDEEMAAIVRLLGPER